ncbi:MAG: branched-chain amino acid ABC transporter substrate-binding protein, partial [Actinomadura sp.]
GKTRRRRGLLLALAAPVAVLLVVGVVFAVRGLPGGDDNAGGGPPKSVKIGFAGALTGADSASFGQPMLNGARLAVNEYNAANPAVRVELVTADTKGDPTQAPAAVQQLVGAGVVGVVGPVLTDEAQTTAPLFEQAQIPNISTAATGRSLSTNGWRFWHRLVASDKTGATSGAEFIARAAKPKRVVVVDDETQYTRDVAADVIAELEEQKVDVDTARISSQDSEYSAAVNKIRSSGADMAFYGGRTGTAARLIRQTREAGVDDVQFMLNDAALSDELVSGAGGGNVEDTLITCSCFDASQGTTQPAKDFRQRYQRAFGGRPGYYTAEGYDAVLAFLAAVKAGRTTSAAINQHLATVDIAGASRKVRFGAGGDATDATVYVYRVQSGRIVLIGDTKTADL